MLESYSQTEIDGFISYVQNNISDPLGIARAALGLTPPMSPADFAAVWNLAEGTSYPVTFATNLYDQVQGITGITLPPTISSAQLVPVTGSVSTLPVVPASVVSSALSSGTNFPSWVVPAAIATAVFIFLGRA